MNIKDIKLSRRSFVRFIAAAGMTTSVPFNKGLRTASAQEVEEAKAEGKWVTVACTTNCGSGRCVNRVYVVNNIMLRQKTDDIHQDLPDAPQLRACVRGRSQRISVTGVDRLRYPMKRKNWAPGGGKRELRGIDEWERISWDDALDLTAGEFKRVINEHGNKAIFAPLTWGNTRLIPAMGGASRAWGPCSCGAWQSISPLTGIDFMTVFSGAPGSINDRLDLRNAKLIVMFGCNPAWSVANSTYHIQLAKQAGAKIIMIDPMYTASGIALADEWIPVRPSTDTALLLGLAYYMIAHDLQDQNFLDKYTTGFDAAHMPSGADPKENFKDYVLGTYDGVPKTLEWASNICGVPVDVLQKLAHEIATTKPMAFLSGYGPARSYMGEQYCQAFLTVGWMTGNVGKSGACVGVSSNTNAFNGGPHLVNFGHDKMPFLENKIMPHEYWLGASPSPFADFWGGPSHNEAWRAVVTGKYMESKKRTGDLDVRIISHLGPGNFLNQFPDILTGIEAHRKVEFVVASDMFPTTSVLYSDIILPVTHPWERYGEYFGANVPSREQFTWGSQAIEPPFETKDDDWIDVELAKRLNIDLKEFIPFSYKQQVLNKAMTTTVLQDDGKTYENLAHVTEQDLEYYGIEGQPQDGRVPIRELQEQGIYRVERKKGDNFEYIAFKDFIDNPEINPLKTESGKFEIYCRQLADYVNGYGWNTKSPIAQYIPPKRGYEETQNGRHTLQLYTPHYLRRAHSFYDNNPWLREAFPQEIFMNTEDANKRGLKHKDTVRIFNEFGSCLRKVTVTERIQPGVVAMGEGAWIDIDPKTGYDCAGNTNVLQGPITNGHGTTGWNTNVVEVEKYMGEELLDDHQIPPRVLNPVA